MNAQTFQTVDLSDLNIINAAELTHTVDDEINTGDDVLFFNEDSNEWELGVYETLWFYHTGGREVSPFLFDDRTMAYIRTNAGGATYADVTTVLKVAPQYPIAFC